MAAFLHSLPSVSSSSSSLLPAREISFSDREVSTRQKVLACSQHAQSSNAGLSRPRKLLRHCSGYQSDPASSLSCENDSCRIFAYDSMFVQGLLPEINYRRSFFGCKSINRNSSSLWPSYSAVEIKANYLSGQPSGGSGSENSEEKAQQTFERNEYFEQVRTLVPDDVKGLLVHVSPEAMDAMKRTILGMLGNLPAEYFSVTFATHRDNMKRLLFSAMMAGFSFRNVEFRVNLARSLDIADNETTERATTPAPEELLVEDELPLEGVQLDEVSGSVRYTTAEGARNMDLATYVARLQSEVIRLKEERDRLQSKRSQDSNMLLDYLQQVEPSKLATLRKDASPEILDAMEKVIANLLGGMNSRHVEVRTTTSRDYMAHLLFWAMMMGYHLRSLENRKELELSFHRSMGTAAPTTEQTTFTADGLDPDLVQ